MVGATMTTWTNWVGNQSFTPASVEAVSSEEDVQRIVARAAEKGTGISTAGTGHSFTPIVETDGVLLDLEKLRGITAVDRDRLLVTAGPKTIIADFGEALWKQGLALSNQGDIDAQAIAGAHLVTCLYLGTPEPLALPASLGRGARREPCRSIRQRTQQPVEDTAQQTGTQRHRQRLTQ